MFWLNNQWYNCPMEKYSPMMQHYLSIKANYPDAIVFYRLGDFYEMFFDDAKVVSNELNLVLTGKQAGVEERVPMCGVPHMALNTHLKKLVDRGYKVAVVEQMEDPKTAKGIVKRDVVRVVTPGTLMDEEARNNVFLSSVVDYQYGYALCLCDMSTGETYLKNLNHHTDDLLQEILKDGIKEIVVNEAFDMNVIMAVRELGQIAISYCNVDTIEERYQPLIEGFKEHYFLSSYGMILNYLNETSKRTIDYLKPVQLDNDDQYLQMNYSTLVNLEITEAARNDVRTMTLWQFLDHTQTAMGGRLLKRWLEKPLINKTTITERQDAITYLKEHFAIRSDLKEKLAQIYDIERLIARVAFGSANAVDGLRLSKSLNVIPELFDLLKEMPAFTYIHQLDQCEELKIQLENAFVDAPPLSIHEGGMFVDGYNAQLDEYRHIQRESKTVIAELEAKEREKLGIKTLKVGYNRVFGYYFEVSKSLVHLIPQEEGYIKKQTLTNGERFITPELKEKEDTIMHAEERAVGLEEHLFYALMDEAKKYLPKLQKIAEAIALVDVIYSLAVVSSQKKYTRPVFCEERTVDIRKGRHPILDEQMKEKKFVANDLKMAEDERIMILTGPNMGGKSTYMRQCALIVVMAQIGCYVPADSATLPVFDRIFTRIGANDDILGGQSTFMVEMNEANYALQEATSRSLIIFDEIGRGTSTYDGMALAQAMIEYIEKNIRALTLFSTHYHELTRLSDSYSGIVNYFVEVYEEDNRVTFLYHVKKGRVNKSYGINVARLAKLPDSVTDRAQNILKDLESNRKIIQQSLLIEEPARTEEKKSEIEEKLLMVDVNNMKPLEALQMIDDLQKEIRKREK